MIEVIPVKVPTLYPLASDIADFKTASCSVRDIIISRFGADTPFCIRIRGDFVPSPAAVNILLNEKDTKIISSYDHSTLAYNSDNCEHEIIADENSLQIIYPWDILKLNEMLLENISNEILGSIRCNVNIDGNIKLGRNSIILPGVYIEGNVIIGENCKIGPNCYIRGKTSIGSDCHIGQAVEIKNSIISDHVSIGHLSYAGDSIIDRNVNFGAGTIISNYRHDKQNHKFMIDGRLIDTGRRKFGAIIGENVHTGIHTAIYPGRSLSPFSSTLPGEKVVRSK